MATIAASAVRSCLGDGPATFAALLAGRGGAAPLRYVDPDLVNVGAAYEIDEETSHRRAGTWLAACVVEALRQADPRVPRGSVPVLAGTGLRELGAAEKWSAGAAGMTVEDLHFTGVLRETDDRLGPVVTVCNACSATGHLLALAQDLVDSGAAPAVVVAGADSLTVSMLAMIGRVAPDRTERIRPFDADRTGVLLGEGAAAAVVVPDGAAAAPLGRLLATGMSCDAAHETAPDADGIARAMREALDRSGRTGEEVDLVLAHGTGTELNDRVEARVLREHLGENGPLVTAIKGATGHTSGASALMSLDVALRCLATGWVPPVAGLDRPAADCGGVRLVRSAPVRARPRLAQVDAFGFGGVNAVTLVGAA
ncbi:beta-ketoacyl synthase N-terminal-like domain-containing protein [Amycolatopsis sp. NPDC059090]|uniref:beta-ketoacyl synthase N-terminal-like domain-containing protein n=1 Tax=unclassified Amycolatopsis TaxID=2618356 RepID=UPI00366D6326